MIRDPASFQILLDTIARLVREKLIQRVDCVARREHSENSLDRVLEIHIPMGQRLLNLLNCHIGVRLMRAT